MRALWIGAGGFVGAIARYGVGAWVGERAGGFPWRTFAVNVSGALLLGAVVAATAGRTSVPENLRWALTVGVLGAYTTFSTFSVETMQLIDRGAAGTAAAYVAASVAASLAAAYAGTWAGRAL